MRWRRNGGANQVRWQRCTSDNNAKEVWSSLFTQSGKVSHLNRVMPCITTTYAHTGAGTPVVLSVQSGAAPLAPRLVDLVEQAERTLETEVERAVVIDSEGCTFDLLESFAKAKRVLITPLKPSRVPALELTYSRGSYYRPYRENGELRTATATLLHKTSGRTLEVGALLVRRAHREVDTVLLTTGLTLGMEGRDLADLYFRRWPIQENAFKEGAAVGLHEHRGNCSRVVANVAVISELERLALRTARDTDELRTLTEEATRLATEVETHAQEQQRAEASLAAQRTQLDDLIAQAKTRGAGFARVALAHQMALVRAEQSRENATKSQAALDKNHTRRTALEARVAESVARQQRLDRQRTIRQLDVAQDTILTALKLTALQLISFVLREYLPSFAMTPQTFIQRVLSIPGRKETSHDQELIVFYENPRDPRINEALREACTQLNRRGLRRDNRQLRFAVESMSAHSSVRLI